MKQGDLVTHWSAKGEVGKIIEVEPDKYSFDDPIYHVLWPHLAGGETSLLIPYRSHHYLQQFKIPDSSDKLEEVPSVRPGPDRPGAS